VIENTRRFAPTGQKGITAMAAPQFFSPPKVKPSPVAKRFTLAQANDSLVYVKRVVSDLSTTHRLIMSSQEKLERMSSKQRVLCEREIAGQKGRFTSLLDELKVVGADLKDARSGLIDFIGRHQGHDVCLCWKLGEDKVSYFHEMDSGFEGRQPISKLQESE
jgi:hypothetical protein